MDLSYLVPQFQEALWSLFELWSSPHVVMRPRVFRDGDAWCALYSQEDLQIGVAGFGPTPQAACEAFDREWRGTQVEAQPGSDSDD